MKRVGHIRAFAALASIASTTAIVHALVVDPWIWSLLRAITGFCLVGLYMVIESWLNVLAPNQHRGRVLAAYMAVTLVALALGQFLILAGDVKGFVPFALVSILLSLALVPIAMTRVEQPKAVEAPRLSLRHLYEISPLGVYGALASGLLNSAFYSMGAVFGQRIGLSEAEIAAFMSATIIGGAALQWPIGHFSDRHDRRVVLVVVCLFAAALATAAFLVVPRFHSALAVIGFLYGGLVFTVYGLSIAHVNDYLKPAEVLEATSGLLLLHGIGASVGPAAAGALMDALGPGSLLVYFTLILVMLGALGLYRMRIRPSPVPSEHCEFVAMASSSRAALEMDPRGDAEPELRLG
ncbi:MAG: hypothetical protein A3G24_18415 [Betaproteobacteria bacterium RIFCSPLOWO2_12_FULL_62_13]|nr:MAG: hypothetical protein A3G24_18415 [Betaproteobacteria bacterium RIFCSPLOWO2_12_FULL_62_13]